MSVYSTPTDGGSQDGYDFKESNAVLIVTATGASTSGSASGVGAGSGTNNDALLNSGLVAGIDGVIFNSSDSTITNNLGGVIEGIDNGVYSSGPNNTIYNYGAITGGSADQFLGGYAVYIVGNDTKILNTGMISGQSGIDLDDTSGAVITNAGTINGFTDSIAADGATNVTIHNSGTLAGDVVFSSGSNVFDGGGGTVDGNIVGGSGDDLFDLSHQIVTGTITGGGGNDTISFNSASGGFAIDLGQGTASGAGEAFDFSGIEKAVGTHYGDTILGDANDNIIAAGAGNDVVAGGGGNDTIDGGAGNDALDGGSGVNTVAYVSAASGVTVSLGAQGSATGGSGSDTLSNFQNLTGSAYADKLIGDGNANVIHGGGGNDLIAGGNGNNALYGDDGNDTIVGGTGNDTIEGDAGRDTLTGGAGADTFVYKLYADSTVAAPDLITDFTSGSDKIDISALHINSSDTFAISSSGGYSFVSVDHYGDGTVDTLIKLTGTNVIQTSDVIWGSPLIPGIVHHAAEPASDASSGEAGHHLAAILHAAALDHHMMA